MAPKQIPLIVIIPPIIRVPEINNRPNDGQAAGCQNLAAYHHLRPRSIRQKAGFLRRLRGVERPFRLGWGFVIAIITLRGWFQSRQRSFSHGRRCHFRLRSSRRNCPWNHGFFRIAVQRASRQDQSGRSRRPLFHKLPSCQRRIGKINSLGG